MDKIKGTDKATDEEVLQKIDEDRSLKETVRKRQE